MSTKKNLTLKRFDDKYLLENENAFDEMKKLIKRGNEVELIVNNYKILLSKSKFLIFKKEKLVLENCFISYEYNIDSENLIINPDTDKKVVIWFRVKDYNDLRSFLWDYKEMSYDNKVLKNGCANEQPAILSFLGATIKVGLYFILLFGSMALFMYITAHLEMFKEHTTFGIFLSMFLALGFAEIVYHRFLDDYLG